MKKKVSLVIGVLMCLVLFAGCGKGIELTEEQSDMISQYAASLLLKYDVNYDNPFVETEKEPIMQGEVEIPGMEEPEKEEPTTPVQPEQVTPPVEEVEGEKENVKNNLTEVFAMEGIQVDYIGCSFTGAYPEQPVAGVQMKAEAGHKLAVLKFSVKNTSAGVRNCNILEGVPTFDITINGVETSARMTILLDDLSTTVEQIPQGASVEKVLLCQVPGEMSENMEQLEVRTTFKQQSGVVYLIP